MVPDLANRTSTRVESYTKVGLVLLDWYLQLIYYFSLARDWVEHATEDDMMQFSVVLMFSDSDIRHISHKMLKDYDITIGFKVYIW